MTKLFAFQAHNLIFKETKDEEDKLNKFRRGEFEIDDEFIDADDVVEILNSGRQIFQNGKWDIEKIKQGCAIAIIGKEPHFLWLTGGDETEYEAVPLSKGVINPRLS